MICFESSNNIPPIGKISAIQRGPLDALLAEAAGELIFRSTYCSRQFERTCVRPFTGVEAPGSFQSLDAVDKSINGPCMGVM
jgi:hypothetical protein